MKDRGSRDPPTDGMSLNAYLMLTQGASRSDAPGSSPDKSECPHDLARRRSSIIRNCRWEHALWRADKTLLRFSTAKVGGALCPDLRPGHE